MHRLIRRRRPAVPNPDLAWWEQAADAAAAKGPEFVAALPGRTGDSIRLMLTVCSRRMRTAGRGRR